MTFSGYYSSGGSTVVRQLPDASDRSRSLADDADDGLSRLHRWAIVPAEKTTEAATYSSKCSIPFFETFASVISSGIQSGLSSGAVSSHAQPS
ncbi:hypothetical protein HTG_08805 [Natrinema mahii]|nr:hypothetical protein HTG_08805 [Natrinema mahii]